MCPKGRSIQSNCGSICMNSACARKMRQPPSSNLQPHWRKSIRSMFRHPRGPRCCGYALRSRPASGNLDAANKDLQEALALAPSNVNSLLNYASLQWKLGQKDAAQRYLCQGPRTGSQQSNRALVAGLSRPRQGRHKARRKLFHAARASAHPKDFAPYLALGDLYTAERNFRAAQTEYENAYQRMPTNASGRIAGGANAALEAHNSDLAKHWLDRAKGKMNDSPQVSRERERYLTLKGDYAESAKLGYAVLEKLPNDREGVVYLAYDLYYLGHYDEALALGNQVRLDSCQR